MGPRPYPFGPRRYKRKIWPMFLRLRREPGVAWTLSPRPGRVVAVIGRRRKP